MQLAAPTGRSSCGAPSSPQTFKVGAGQQLRQLHLALPCAAVRQAVGQRAVTAAGFPTGGLRLALPFPCAVRAVPRGVMQLFLRWVLPLERLGRLDHSYLSTLHLSTSQLADGEAGMDKLLGKPWPHVSPLQQAFAAVRLHAAKSFEHSSRLYRLILSTDGVGGIVTEEQKVFALDSCGEWWGSGEPHVCRLACCLSVAGCVRGAGSAATTDTQSGSQQTFFLPHLR